MGGGGGGVRCQTFSFVLFPVQQTTSGIGYRVKYFFRVGNQYAECEKQQQQQQQQRCHTACGHEGYYHLTLSAADARIKHLVLYALVI